MVEGQTSFAVGLNVCVRAQVNAVCELTDSWSMRNGPKLSWSSSTAVGQMKGNIPKARAAAAHTEVAQRRVEMCCHQKVNTSYMQLMP